MAGAADIVRIQIETNLTETVRDVDFWLVRVSGVIGGLGGRVVEVGVVDEGVHHSAGGCGR